LTASFYPGLAIFPVPLGSLASKIFPMRAAGKMLGCRGYNFLGYPRGVKIL
jgi:hypothetical protein